MKKTTFHITSFFLLFLVFTGCIDFGPGIVGEGEMIKRTVDLPTITGVKSGIGGDIIIREKKGGSQEVKLFGQANILDNLELKVKNGILNILYKQNVRSYEELRIELSISTFNYVGLNGSGSITTPPTFADLDRLDVELNGSGEILLKAEAKNIIAAVNGSGDIILFGLADRLKAEINGSGDIQAFGLDVDEVNASVSGSGDIEVSPKQSLDAQVFGSGDILYKGEPDITKNIRGSGEIENALE
jgi:hypothetical protein